MSLPSRTDTCERGLIDRPRSCPSLSSSDRYRRLADLAALHIGASRCDAVRARVVAYSTLDLDVAVALGRPKGVEEDAPIVLEDDPPVPPGGGGLDLEVDVQVAALVLDIELPASPRRAGALPVNLAPSSSSASAAPPMGRASASAASTAMIRNLIIIPSCFVPRRSFPSAPDPVVPAPPSHRPAFTPA